LLLAAFQHVRKFDVASRGVCPGSSAPGPDS
jgi:hypothetical protein